ncbi:MAG: sensor histidine kinase [Nocardioides sp.]
MAVICKVCLDAAHAAMSRIEDARRSAIARYTKQQADAEAERVRAHWDSLVHDEILTALSALAMDAPEASTMAANAVAATTRLAAGDLAAPELTDGLLAAAVEVFPQARTEVTVSDRPCKIPARVRLAIVEAATEALRNAAAHAWPSNAIGAVDLIAAHDERVVQVTIQDNGVGFSVDRVEVDRLGIHVSIRDRMTTVGGVGDVQSRPGIGTRVTLSWPDPDSTVR